MGTPDTVRAGYLNNAAGKAALAKRISQKNQADILYQGIAIALATVNRQHDQPTCVCDALRGLGIDLADLKDAGVEKYDLDEIKKCLRQGGPLDRAQLGEM